MCNSGDAKMLNHLELGTAKQTNGLSPNKAKAGFTLLELAISLAVIGILISGALVSTEQLIKAENIRETQRKTDFVMNALSAYVQTHYRLPCPADPGAPAAQAGREINGGNCLQSGTNANMYWQTTGIVPWKELGIPQSMVVDGWKRYITYKPAPNLTANMLSPQMQDIANANTLDINHACRTAMWYDAGGNHVNRAKALFCCNAQPTASYLTSVGQPPTMPAGWRKTGVVSTTTALNTASSATSTLPDATPTLATSNWTAPADDIDLNGTFTTPHYMENASVPLIRSSGTAVTLISHGSNGNLAFMPEWAKNLVLRGTVNAGGIASGAPDVEQKNIWPPQMFAGVLGHPKTVDGSYDVLGNRTTASDDLVSYMRTDQLFAKVGNGSCELPPAAAATTYACIPQEFDEAVKKLKDPVSGDEIEIPEIYGLQLKLTGGKYKLKTSFTQKLVETSYSNSFGFYTIGKDGTIKDVSMIEKNINNASLNNDGVKPLQSPTPEISQDIMGIGVFIVANAYNNNDYSTMDFITHGQSNLKFMTDFGGAGEKDANIKDTGVSLVYVDPVTGQKTRIHGQANSDAYHMYSNLNDAYINRTMRDDHVCHYAGEKVGPNGNHTCKGPSAVQEVGVDSKDNRFINAAFEDLQVVQCYHTKAGPCVPNAPVEDRLTDAYGGYLVSIGDNDYDDVSFNFRMVACPEGS
jgi:prepilin-type N-terminal cleavage/methylation domain-containing protein